MGLGLPLARRIIEVHQGDLDIQSRVGRSTQVTVRLPLAHSG
jgi:signal transduction histidine kinase